MATISSTLALNDAMSPVLQSIASALASINAALDQIGTPTMDASGIQAANRALQQTEDIQDDITESIEESRSAADGLWSKIAGFVAAYAGWELVRSTVAWSDEMSNIQARLAQVNDGSRTQGELMQAIYANAQDAHASLQGMADIVGRFGNNARDAFKSNDELLAFSNQLYKMFTIAGTDANGAAAAMLQLSQGLGAGALRGEELNSVFEQAPIIIQTIANHLGVPIGKIREMASEGKLTADVVKNALLSAADETNAKFAAMPLTFSAAWTMAKNTFQMNMMGLQKVLSEAINQQQFQEMMNGITAAVSSLASIAIPIVKGLTVAIGFMYENWGLIAPIILTVLGLMALYKGAVLATAAVELISAGYKAVVAAAQTAYAIATGTATSATIAATAAQWGLNAAMLASPITWIVVAIAALIGLLYLVVAIINRVAGTSLSATGLIVGYLGFFFAFWKNQIAVIWNIILSLAEFFMNVWTNPIYSIKKLIYSLAETFSGFYMGVLKGLDPVITGIAKGFLWAVNKGIKAINWLGKALNKVGLGWDSINEMKMEGTVAGNAEAVRQKVLGALDPGTAPDNYKSLDHLKMDFADPRAYAKKGYDAGAKFASDPGGTINRALGLSNDPAIQQLMQGQQTGNKLAAQTAKNTQPKAEEDYKYLKEIMAGGAVDRLSGTDIKIEMTNNNRINSALDLDNIVKALTQKLTGAMDSAGEGVHF